MVRQNIHHDHGYDPLRVLAEVTICKCVTEMILILDNKDIGPSQPRKVCPPFCAKAVRKADCTVGKDLAPLLGRLSYTVVIVSKSSVCMHEKGKGEARKELDYIAVFIRTFVKWTT